MDMEDENILIDKFDDSNNNNNEYDHIRDYVKNSVNDEETQLLISDFAILWNEYEEELYSNGHHIYMIKNKINNLNIDNRYANKICEYYDQLVEYIESRGEFSYEGIVRGYHIKIKKPEIDSHGIIRYKGDIWKKELKRIVNADNVKDKLYFLLVIIARVRNNMFHGLKGIYDLKYQKDLFKTCNKTLKMVLDIKRRRNPLDD